MKADELSLARLMVMAQAGDKQAYCTLLNECQVWLRRYFGRRVAPGQLDDLVQDTLFALHHKLATWDSTRAFMPWLAAIARYRWVDHLRKIYRADEIELAVDLAEVDEEPAIAARISLERLFAQLPDAQVRAIELVKIEGLSVSEASRACGQSESLIKVNIHRGLKRLTALIEKA
ncbi:sigma-70 family RNA polymerase sigma factor [Novosphingobium sp. B 225]|uniref:sigma-70 family RNA polymerase sigma factor n=1 Tax=Novosphingobium sp. B 225 TaxID=1961849 RepID=UPI000B4B44AE|nr:sigma-70 family RNA polymerase sigma factor [Novosphingobium sp. B 225]